MNVFFASQWVVGTAQKNEVIVVLGSAQCPAKQQKRRLDLRKSRMVHGNPFFAQKDVIAVDAGELLNIRLSINMYEESAILAEKCRYEPLQNSGIVMDNRQVCDFHFPVFSIRGGTPNPC